MNTAIASSEPLPEEGLYPIRTVSAVTGVNPVTLRAWERRYNLLSPQRTPKGHRLYTLEQIETVRKVVALLDQGIAISQVKPLLGRVPRPQAEPTQYGEIAEDSWETSRERMLGAIGAFDDRALDRLFADTLSLHPVDTVTQRLTIPRSAGHTDCPKSTSCI